MSLGEQRQYEAHGSNGLARPTGLAVRIGIGLLVVAQSMIFSLGINLEDDTPRDTKLVVQGAVLAGTLLVAILLGGPLVRSAVAELRRHRLTMESLFLLTMAGAMAASLQSFFSGHGPVYFEVVSVLLVVYSLGKALGARARAAAISSTRAWAGSLSRCRVVDASGRAREEDVAAIVPGDLVEVRPGEAVAVDGIVRAGVGFVSEAAVSGEPFAIVKRPGDRVLAGCASHDATFRIEASSAGTARQIDQLLEAVEAARSRPASVQATADRLAAVFFPLLVAIAAATFGGWTYAAGWEVGLFNAMSVLLVACPCALGLATPVVVWSALGRLAERGLVVRDGDAVERLAGVTCVVFDKTGTLTEDHFALVDMATAATGEDRARVLGWMAAVQEHSQHPIARPFADLPQPTIAIEVESLNVVPGCGVEAVVCEGTERHTVRIGRPEWVAAPMAEADALISQLHAAAGHRIDCSIDGRLAAVAMLAERLRDSVPQTFSALNGLGVGVEVLTGDTTDRARALHLPNVRGGCLPGEKRQRILDLIATGERPLVVGDGINDAAALAAAHVGIALASGTDLANGAAAATLYHGDLQVIPWAIALGREAKKVIRRNLWMAAGYNLLGVALAAGGVLHPVAAALLMVASSVLVAWSATRVGVAGGHDCGDLSVALDFDESPVLRASKWPHEAMAIAHALAIGLQGLVLVSLLELSDTAALFTVAGFALVGAMAAAVWYRWPTIPHGIDMAFGMLTLGNLGMVGGWWADEGFGPIRDGSCGCAAAAFEGVWRPWMWVGMYTLGNLGMAVLARRPHLPSRFHRPAMFVGGNLGMGVGMLAGGWLASFAPLEAIRTAAELSLIGMTAGMVAGMIGGTRLARRLIPALLALSGLPRWLARPAIGDEARLVRLSGLR